jgi:hypothetical protein
MSDSVVKKKMGRSSPLGYILGVVGVLLLLISAFFLGNNLIVTGAALLILIVGTYIQKKNGFA